MIRERSVKDKCFLNRNVWSGEEEIQDGSRSSGMVVTSWCRYGLGERVG